MTDIVEVMADAIQRKARIDAFGEDIDNAEVCAQAALDALKAEGFAVVPVEPSEAMKKAGCDVLICNSSGSWVVAAGVAYRAMIAAAGDA